MAATEWWSIDRSRQRAESVVQQASVSRRFGSSSEGFPMSPQQRILNAFVAVLATLLSLDSGFPPRASKVARSSRTRVPVVATAH
jgi:hypothetical protein